MSDSKSLLFFSCLLALVMVIGSGSMVLGDSQSGSGSKKSSVKAESCDGAADIVPAKPMSFTRKRRPAPKESTAESKAEKKQAP